jgi:nitrate reductase NapD
VQPIDPYRLAGVVVRALPDRLSDVSGRLSALPGVDVHHQEQATGRLVITLESSGPGSERDQLERVRSEAGVISAELVYHYVEPPEAAERPVGMSDPGEP